MPAAALILVVLGALAVDQALVFGAQRDLVATAEAAANDAVAVGVDIEQLRSDGRVGLDTRRVDQAVSLAMARSDGVVTHRWWIADGVLHVRVERSVDLVFTKGLPGAADRRTVVATASAELRRT